MPMSFTGTEFVKVLSEGNLREPIVKQGMVKPSEGDSASIQFSEGTACHIWTRIPVEMIERVEYISTVRCHDHQHPLVRLFLKEPPAENKAAAVLSELLRASGQGQTRTNVTQAASGLSYCGCSGTCENGTGTGATGSGTTIAAAISDCESKLRQTCWPGSLKTYVGGGCSGG